ncbi:MAG: sensor histidine kinase N-terminal domain-containing protein [Nitrospirae bacterium]|nr:sensor histidine kinase N-terminal domain-containing protein [Nitrospirota bacterium]
MKIFPKSIKGRLFFWFLSLTSILLITVSLFLYHEVERIIFASVDRALHSQLQVITGLLHEEDGRIELELSEIIAGAYSIPRSGHYYQVLMNGRLLAASPSLADEDINLTSAKLEYYDEALSERVYTSVGPDNEPVRIKQHDLDFLGIPVSVFAAESIADSLEMINMFKRFLLIAASVGILIISFAGLWAANHSLDPLKIFSSDIENITHKTLSKRIDVEAVTNELSVLADSFNAMLDRLQKAFETERRLVADASHELKTPVTVIKTHCDVLLQKDRTKDEYVEALSTIRTVSENMGRLIKDLLSLARLDSGMLSPDGFKIVSLNECIREAAQMAVPLTEKKSVTINTVLKDDINITGNKDRLTEVFLNIIENAVNYNKENGAVEITTARNNNTAVISVLDTGPGIGQDDLEKIFERFYRADTSRSEDGTGLGLSISKIIVEAHGGNIKVESAFGKGSRFLINLPL